jgi:hypothetical protein
VYCIALKIEPFVESKKYIASLEALKYAAIYYPSGENLTA